MRKLYFLIILVFSTTALRAMKRREMPVVYKSKGERAIWERTVKLEKEGSEYTNIYHNDSSTGRWKLVHQIAHCRTNGFRYERITQYTVRTNDVLVEMTRFAIRENDDTRISIDDGADQERIITHREYDKLDQRRGGSVVIEFLVPMSGGTLTGTGMD